MFLLASAVVIAGVLGWRWASRRFRLPCPSWLAWILSNPYTRAVASAESILDRADVSRGMRVLDAGSGPGRLTIPAAERVGPTGTVVAVDVQAAMLRRVRVAADERHLDNVQTLQGSLDSEVPGACDFDRALLVTVLGEIPDRAGAMRALYGALRFCGILSISEMIPDPHYQSRETVRRLAEQAGFDFDRMYGTWLAFTMNFRKSLT